MNNYDRKATSARERIAAAVFYIIFILLFPITLVGYILWVGKLLLAGRTSGVSITAQGPLSARWFQHILGTRRDEASYRLMLMLPGVPRLGLGLVAEPLLLAHRASGYVPKAFRYPFEGDIPMQYEASARVTFFDSVVERSLADVTQFVILGAGFDTRAFRLPKQARIRSFESMPRRPRRSSTRCSKRPASMRAGSRSSAPTSRRKTGSPGSSTRASILLLQHCSCGRA